MTIALHEHNANEEWTVKFDEKQFTVNLISSKKAEDGYIAKHFALTTANPSLSDDLELYRYQVRFGSYQLIGSDGTLSIGEASDFNFFYPDACSNNRLKNEGDGTEVSQLNMVPSISCVSPHALIFGRKLVPSGSVTCSEEGWKDQEGNFVWEHSSEAQIESEIPVVCRKLCSEDRLFRVPNDGDSSLCTYKGDTLSCKAKYQLIFDNKEMIEEVKCSDAGWTMDGKMVWEHSSEANFEDKIPVTCRPQCDASFVKSKNADTSENKELKCSYDREALKITYSDGETKVTLKQKIRCHEGTGWKEIGPDGNDNGVVIVEFSKKGANFTVECVNSCTQDLIEQKCGIYQGCSMPQMKNNHKIMCENKDILYYEKAKTFHKSEIECANEVFKVGTDTKPNEVEQRLRPGQKIGVSCISKCDVKFTKFEVNVLDVTNDKHIEETKDANGMRVLRCTHPTSILNFNGARSLEAATCDIAVGWRWISSSEAFFKFDNVDYEISPECLNMCADRVKSKPIAGVKNTIEPKQSGNSYFCPATHLLRTNDGTTELLNDKVVCTREGMVKESDSTYLLKFTPSKIFEEKFYVECVSKCYDAFRKITGDYAYEDDTERTSFSCRDSMNILEINNKRMFGDVLKCEEAKGWKFGTDHVFPFTTTVHMKAKCIKVCTAESFKDPTCTSGDTNCRKHKLVSESDKNSALFTCGDNSKTAAIFLNTKQTRGEVRCTINGWTETTSGTTKKLIDFMDIAVQIPKIVDVECREFCSESLIDNATCATGTNCVQHVFSPDTKQLSCGSDKTVALFVNGELTKGDVKCSREGWIEILPAPPSITLVDSKSLEIPPRVKVECRKLCADSLIVNKDGLHKFTAHNILSCGSEKTIALYFDGKEIKGEVKCTRDGWFEDTTALVDFNSAATSLPHKPTVECKKLCSDSLINRKGDASELVDFQPSTPIKCKKPKEEFQFLLNDKSSFKGKVLTGATCTRRGWEAEYAQPQGATPEYPVDFEAVTSTLPQTVTVECKSKCDSSFVKIENTCTATDGPACDKPKYENGTLSCAHATDKLVFTNAGLGTPLEILGNLTCSIKEGWREDNEGKKLIVNPTPGKFTVTAKCIRVCDQTALTAATGTRSYAPDGILTCKDEKEMLEFAGKAIYSDVVCSKEGWTKLVDNTVLAKYEGTPIIANCVPNPCTKDGIEQCIPLPNKVCQQPDITTIKYRMTCKKPMKLKYDNINNRYYEELICKDGKWNLDSSIVVPADVPLPVKCVAGLCAQCGDTYSAKKIPCDNLNCVVEDTKFEPGDDDECSRYRCIHEAYKYINDVGFTKYFAAKAIKADDACKYKTEDGLDITGTFGCIKQIPCSENAPLDLSCQQNVNTNVKCEPNLPKSYLTAEKNGIKEPTLKCSNGFALYHHVSGDTWEAVSQLQCTKAGKWKATIESTTKDVEHRERFVCANGNPSIVPTTPPPPPPPLTVCNHCRQKKIKKTCDECKNLDDDFIFDVVGEKCTAKSSTGSNIITSSGEFEEVFCKKEGNEYVWRTAKGEQIKNGEFAAKIGGSTSKNFSGLAIAGIVFGVILIFVLIGGGVAFFLYRRKQKALATERLKSKGLEQKMDSIIDNVSVTDDVKTLVI